MSDQSDGQDPHVEDGSAPQGLPRYGDAPSPPPGDYPPQAPYPVGQDPYAHWGLRLGAYVLDGLIAFGVMLPLYLVGFVFLSIDTDPYGEVEGGPLTIVGVLFCFASLALYIGFLFWNFGIRQGRTGQSLGKQVLSIRVVRNDGLPLGTWLSIGRLLLFSVLTSCTCYINALWPLWDERKQALHDKVVDTVVIRA